MDMEELKSVYYGLDILSEPVLLEKQLPLGAVHVTSKYGQQYQCSFPDHSEAEKKKEEEEKEAVEMGIVEMLKPLQSKPCLTKTKDWWTYEFCYGKHIRQYHMEDKSIKGLIIHLGFYESDFDWNNDTAKDERLKASSLSSYHSQTYSLGDKCDLTGNPRQAEVRFVCEEKAQDQLSRIEESETCVYTLTVVTSRTCRHPYLKPPLQRKAVPITCNPVLSEQQFHDYMVELNDQKKTKEEKKDQTEKDVLNKNTNMEKELEDALMSSAKDLLSEPKGSLFPEPGEDGLVTRESFEEMFGANEQLWKLYQQGLEVARKNAEKKKNRIQELKELLRKEKSEKLKEGDKQDEEVLSEFSEEIDNVKKRFKRTGEKLRSIKTKLANEKLWEKNIEDAVKEAEEELGVKVNHNLVSGLSKTLNKLVNKLQDTEAEWSSMEKEIEGLTKVDNKDDGSAKQEAGDMSNTQDKVKDVHREKESTEDKKKMEEKEVWTDEELQSKGERLDKKQMDGMKLKPDKTSPSQLSREGTLGNKIKSPPRSDDSNMDYTNQQLEVPSTFPLPKDPNHEDATAHQAGDKPTPPEADLPNELEGLEKAAAALPDNIRDLLEETVRKELENKAVRKGGGKLGLDNDHSFLQDKTVHVIQQEDKDGNTNKFIFVLGFKNIDEEATEQERQSTLEENYEFVYKPKQGKEARDEGTGEGPLNSGETQENPNR